MAGRLQFRRGTTLQNEAFTGAVGEPTLDTETGMIHIHDGVTQGGKEFIDAVVAFQKPTAANNYTWYRKYASGWVEQGQRSLNIANKSYNLYTLPVPMANTDYWAAAGPAQISSTEMYNAASTVAALAVTTTQVRLGQFNTANATMRIWWEVKGMAA